MYYIWQVCNYIAGSDFQWYIDWNIRFIPSILFQSVYFSPWVALTYNRTFTADKSFLAKIIVTTPVLLVLGYTSAILRVLNTLGLLPAVVLADLRGGICPAPRGLFVLQLGAGELPLRYLLCLFRAFILSRRSSIGVSNSKTKQVSHA